MPADLHIALQHWYAGDDGLVETQVDGYRADVLRDGIIYEIQTRSFTAIRDKLRKLAKKRSVVLVHPIAQTKFIAKLDPDTGEELSVRRSPKRGRPADVFNELLYLRKVIKADNIRLEIVMTVERELRCDDGEGSWRRKGVSGATASPIPRTCSRSCPTICRSASPPGTCASCSACPREWRGRWRGACTSSASSVARANLVASTRTAASRRAVAAYSTSASPSWARSRHHRW